METYSILKLFPLDGGEYEELERKFGDLCKFAAWELRRKNVRNNPGIELDDFVQELRISLVYAGSYYKRQMYIEDCLNLCNEYVTDEFTKQVVAELSDLWKNRTRHGANRRKFGEHQEILLNDIVKRVVPPRIQPKKDRPLEIDKKFITYCKSIAWNKQKYLGKKITKDRTFRSGLVSLSDFDFLARSKNISSSRNNCCDE